MITFWAGYSGVKNFNKSAEGSEALTVFTLTSNEERDDGRLTKQFLRCISDISAVVAWLPRLLVSGAISRLLQLRQSCLILTREQCSDFAKHWRPWGHVRSSASGASVK